MNNSTLLAQIAAKKSDKESIADQVVLNPGSLPELFEGLNSDRPEIKYGCSKVLRLVSERHPALLYPQFDLFLNLLDCENNFLKWDAGRIIANLAAVDSRNRLDRMINRYLQPIRGPVMITAANLIANAAHIALEKPNWADKIARRILQVEKAEYQTAECRNVAIGHAIRSLDQFVQLVRGRAAVLAFVRRQRANRRPAVRKAAAAFLSRHDITPRVGGKPVSRRPER